MSFKLAKGMVGQNVPGATGNDGYNSTDAENSPAADVVVENAAEENVQDNTALKIEVLKEEQRQSNEADTGPMADAGSNVNDVPIMNISPNPENNDYKSYETSDANASGAGQATELTAYIESPENDEPPMMQEELTQESSVPPNYPPSQRDFQSQKSSKSFSGALGGQGGAQIAGGISMDGPAENQTDFSKDKQLGIAGAGMSGENMSMGNNPMGGGFAFQEVPVNIDIENDAIMIGDNSISEGAIDIHLGEPGIVDPGGGILDDKEIIRPEFSPGRPSIIALLDWKPATMIDADTDKKVNSALGFTQPVKDVVDLRFKQSFVRIQAARECVAKIEEAQTAPGLAKELRDTLTYKVNTLKSDLKSHIELYNMMQHAKKSLLFKSVVADHDIEDYNNVFYSKYVTEGDAGFPNPAQENNIPGWWGTAGPDAPTPFVYGNVKFQPHIGNFLGYFGQYDYASNSWANFSATKAYAKIIEELIRICEVGSWQYHRKILGLMIPQPPQSTFSLDPSFPGSMGSNWGSPILTLPQLGFKQKEPLIRFGAPYSNINQEAVFQAQLDSNFMYASSGMKLCHYATLLGKELSVSAGIGFFSKLQGGPSSFDMAKVLSLDQNNVNIVDIFKDIFGTFDPILYGTTQQGKGLKVHYDGNSSTWKISGVSQGDYNRPAEFITIDNGDQNVLAGDFNGVMSFEGPDFKSFNLDTPGSAATLTSGGDFMVDTLVGPVGNNPSTGDPVKLFETYKLFPGFAKDLKGSISNASQCCRYLLDMVSSQQTKDHPSSAEIPLADTWDNELHPVSVYSYILGQISTKILTKMDGVSQDATAGPYWDSNDETKMWRKWIYDPSTVTGMHAVYMTEAFRVAYTRSETNDSNAKSMLFQLLLARRDKRLAKRAQDGDDQLEWYRLHPNVSNVGVTGLNSWDAPYALVDSSGKIIPVDSSSSKVGIVANMLAEIISGQVGDPSIKDSELYAGYMKDVAANHYADESLKITEPIVVFQGTPAYKLDKVVATQLLTNVTYTNIRTKLIQAVSGAGTDDSDDVNIFDVIIDACLYLQQRAANANSINKPQPLATDLDTKAWYSSVNAGTVFSAQFGANLILAGPDTSDTWDSLAQGAGAFNGQSNTITGAAKCTRWHGLDENALLYLVFEMFLDVLGAHSPVTSWAQEALDQYWDLAGEQEHHVYYCNPELARQLALYIDYIRRVRTGRESPNPDLFWFENGEFFTQENLTGYSSAGSTSMDESAGILSEEKINGGKKAAITIANITADHRGWSELNAPFELMFSEVDAGNMGLSILEKYAKDLCDIGTTYESFLETKPDEVSSYASYRLSEQQDFEKDVYKGITRENLAYRSSILGSQGLRTPLIGHNPQYTFENDPYRWFSPDEYVNGEHDLKSPSLGQGAPYFGQNSWAMHMLYSDPELEFPRGGNVKVLAVGIPPGLIEQLRDAQQNHSSQELVGTDLAAKNNLADESQSTVIRVNVVRKSMLYDEIVFETQRFSYDMCVFLPYNFSYYLSSATGQIALPEMPASPGEAPMAQGEFEHLGKVLAERRDPTLRPYAVQDEPDWEGCFTPSGRQFKSVVEQGYWGGTPNHKQATEGPYARLGGQPGTFQNKREIRGMLLNHFRDRLLKLYYRTGFGVRFDEGVFMPSKYSSLNDVWISELGLKYLTDAYATFSAEDKKYLSTGKLLPVDMVEPGVNAPGGSLPDGTGTHFRVKTVADLTNEINAGMINEAEVRMFRMIAGMPFLKKTYTLKHQVPLVFDRTFLIPIDIDRWRIDLVNTPQDTIETLQGMGAITGTAAGGMYLLNQGAQVQMPNYGNEAESLYPITTEEIVSFDQYYCYIELV